MSKRHERIGWVLFIGSACFFVVASLRSGDLYSLAGSLLFLVACFFFVREKGARDGEAAPSQSR